MQPLIRSTLYVRPCVRVCGAPFTLYPRTGQLGRGLCRAAGWPPSVVKLGELA